MENSKAMFETTNQIQPVMISVCENTDKHGTVFTIWFFNMAMENGPFIDGLPIKNGGFFHGKLAMS